MEICPKCGLPKPTCVCEQIVKSSQKIKVSLEKKRYGKTVTVVAGFDRGVDIKQITKDLKNQLACGGTFDKKSNTIELQGDHSKRIKDLLIKIGFNEDSID